MANLDIPAVEISDSSDAESCCSSDADFLVVDLSDGEADEEEEDSDIQFVKTERSVIDEDSKVRFV